MDHNLWSIVMKLMKVNLPGMYSDSPQKQTPPEDFYIESSHETVQRLHHAYRHDFRYHHDFPYFQFLYHFPSEFLVIRH